ncbi:histidine kinase dimerization/phosphoacceptor domain -containing protein [Halarcobacter sp.]|uniref:histidine kinase dimerization/phosphoacceptor domain -containing protein n=1 Tax=Halarcobacter sp. TaxID=2321133 RepID=UPI002AA68CF1|nr:histidine kinase dimerization/phosphoacceptor domain -containing protein [Halarcobacter sp.]
MTNIQEKVHAMELLYRKLYESQDFSSISLNRYIYLNLQINFKTVIQIMKKSK